MMFSFKGSQEQAVATEAAFVDSKCDFVVDALGRIFTCFARWKREGHKMVVNGLDGSGWFWLALHE